MNTAIFCHLVWKEYRQQRALWMAIALAGLIFQVAVLIYCSLNGVPELADKLFTVALSVPVLYSLGCGAALFAGEHEAETFPFLQALPVSAGRVFFAKLTFAVLSALLLFPVLWLLAFAMASWELPDAVWHLQLWGGGVVATLEVLIWAVLGSLVLRRVLPAAIASGVIAVLLGYSSLVLVMTLGSHYQPQADEYFRTLPLRSGFALIALAITVAFGRHWFHEHPLRWSLPATQRERASVQHAAGPARRRTVFARLAWHEWRQGRTTMLWCVFGYIALGTWLAIAQRDNLAYFAILPVLATLFGASAFAADQRQSQYQFFTEHGVRPRLVWLSRQFVWGFALTIIVASAALLQLFDWPLASHQLHQIGSLVGVALLTFATGQLCSILIRSGIVAVFVAVLSNVLIGVWAGSMLGLGVPWVLAALPLPFIFFWASWLYAPKWIQQRQTWRVRIVTTATILVPLLGVVVATAAYRVYEIPAIVLSFDPALPQPDDSPAVRETAAMYQEAEQILRQRLTANAADDSTEISSRDDEWQKGIDLFLAAGRRTSCYFDPRFGGVWTPFDGQQLTLAVLAEARARTEAGDLEGAAELHDGLLQLAARFYNQNDFMLAEYYGTAVEQQVFLALPDWANHESLTAQRLQQALAELQSWCAVNGPDWKVSVIERRRAVQQLIAAEGEIMDRMSATERAAIKTIGTLLPWERWRASRLTDVCTEAELQGIPDIRARAVRLPPEAQRTMQWDVRLDLGHGRQRLIRSNEVEVWLGTTPWLPMNLTAPSYVLSEKQYQSRRSAVQTQLALIAWRKEHGELPDSLHKLIGNPFEDLPLDPYTDQPFVYFPNGVEEEVSDDGYPTGDMTNYGLGMGSPGSSAEDAAPPKPRLVRSEPFLWSPGWQIRYAPGSHRGPSGSPTAGDFRDQTGNVLSDQDLLHQGERYPIPQAKQQPSDSSGDADALPNDE